MVGRGSVLVIAAALLAAAPSAARAIAPETSLAVAAAAARSGQHGVAAKLFRDATRAAPQNAAAWLGLGVALAANNHVGEALAAFERAVELAPALPGLARARGRAELGAGRTAAAEASFRGAAARDAGDTRSWVGLGIALDLQGRHGDAQAAYRSALRADPLDQPAQNNLALSRALAGHAGEAAATLALWAIAADAPPRMRANLGLLRAVAAPGAVPGANAPDPGLVAAMRARSPARRP